ncbi:MAG: NAD(P)-dependent oxidoreductase [Candidatus Binatia bacterium]|nr:NAD(P)-dependent oxidoreductase [Candidatus Binatia bacterium]
MSAPLKILSHFPRSRLTRLEADVADIEIIEVDTEGDVAQGIEGEVLLTRPWGTPNMSELLRRGVRWVHTVGTGVDRFPMDEIGDRILTCSRGASATPISEWIVTMMLAYEKRLPEVWLSEPPEAWSVGGDLGSLDGRVLGLVGLGSIGLGVARRVEAFGMRTIACRRKNAPSPMPGIEITSFEDVIERADHLVIAAPATKATKQLLDAEAFSRVKAGVHLVNIARGSLIDHDALRAALDSGRIARASLDTVDPEPVPMGHWLYEHPSVRLSPHVSWSMPNVLDSFLGIFADNVGRYRRGEELHGVVDLVEGY